MMQSGIRLLPLGAALFAGCLAAGPVAAGHYEDAVSKALATAGAKPVLVDFYTDW